MPGLGNDSPRNVLVTGASSGLGRALALWFARRGATVWAAARRTDMLEGLAADPSSRPGTIVPLSLDVSDVGAIRRVLPETDAKAGGGLDVVIANAGIAPWGPIRTIEPEAFEATIEVNLLGVWRTIRTALPHVIERKGYILPIASLAAAIHTPIIGHYNAAKAGVEGFANALRMEMRPYGVDVGCGYFGFLDTDMVRAPESDEILAEEEFANSRAAFGQPAPVSKGVEKIVRGIEGRSRRVYYPPWIIAPLLAPAQFQRLIELGMARRGVFETIRKLDERAQRRAQSPV